MTMCMKSVATIGLLLASLKLFAVLPPEPTLNQQIQTVVNHALVKYKLPALSVSIQLPNENKIRNYVAGTTTLKGSKAITPRSLFQFGSVTKTYTATMIMKLVAEHKLSTNDKLGQFFPQYPRWKNITVAQLMHHTSGVFNYIDAKDFWVKLKKHPQTQFTLKQLADLAYQYPDPFKAGHSYAYTNTDYILLGMIIEKVTKLKATEAYGRYLFKPYRLNETYYAGNRYPKGVYARMAHGYDNEGTFGYNKDITDYSLSFASTAGALVSTPGDVTQFLRKLFNGDIVPPHILKQMQTVVTAKNKTIHHVKNYLRQHPVGKQGWLQVGQGYGFGLVYFKDAGFTWMHTGGVDGYQSFYGVNACNGMIVTGVYSSQPKEQFIFLNIYRSLVHVLNQSKFVKMQIRQYQRTHKLPAFCAAHK